MNIKVNDQLGSYFQTKKRFETRGPIAADSIQYSGRHVGHIDQHSETSRPSGRRHPASDPRWVIHLAICG